MGAGAGLTEESLDNVIRPPRFPLERQPHRQTRSHRAVAASMIRRPWAITSLPIPSPGMTAIRKLTADDHNCQANRERFAPIRR